MLKWFWYDCDDLFLVSFPFAYIIFRFIATGGWDWEVMAVSFTLSIKPGIKETCKL